MNFSKLLLALPRGSLHFYLSFILTLLVCFPDIAFAKSSQCYGTIGRGRLLDGKKLPSSGKNFSSYSFILRASGRTYVHSQVHGVLMDAFKSLETSQKGVHYIYGETGKKSGGKFSPHKTHQNGTSVDLMVPVVNRKTQKKSRLSCSVFNKFCYSIEFDKKGRTKNLEIDYEALAGLIYELHKSGEKLKVPIRRVIFDPKLQPFLFKTRLGKSIKNNIKFTNKRSWVRHDEHIHIDFNVPCKKY